MRRNRRILLAFGPPLFVCWLTACAEREAGLSSGRPREGWSTVRLAGAGYEATFDAAVQATRQWFPRMDARRDGGRIVAGPVEYDQEGGTSRLRDVIGYRNKMRRTATIIVREQPNGCAVDCVVQVQRLDTADYRGGAARDLMRGDDRPSDTPLDRDAGLIPDQREEWTDLPRDRALERQILDSIRLRVAPPGGGSALAP